MEPDKDEAQMANVTWKYGRQTSDDAIRALEKTLTINLPADFINVARANDGGRPRPKAVDIHGGREVVFERLLSIEGSGSETILEAAGAVGGRSSEGLVPFGRDPFGNLFCFVFRAQQCTEVVFWDHESGKSSPLCTSFATLLALLHEPVSD
jgi:hypothetical protein